MAYDHDLADRIRELMPLELEHEEKPMFGGLAFLIGGHMAIGASREGGVLVRTDSADEERLLRSKGVSVAIMRGRPATGWLRVAGDSVRTTRQLSRWVGIGTASAVALPPKSKPTPPRPHRR